MSLGIQGLEFYSSLCLVFRNEGFRFRDKDLPCIEPQAAPFWRPNLRLPAFNLKLYGLKVFGLGGIRV